MRAPTYILLLSFAILLSGCGWHLRGTVVLPESLRAVHVTNQANNSVLAGELKSLLNANQVTVVDSLAEAQLIITIIDHQEDRRTASFGSNARVTEYELSSEANYSVADAEGNLLLPPTDASVLRNYRYDENDVVGKAGEERLLQQEMRRELAQQILRRLRFLNFDTDVSSQDI